MKYVSLIKLMHLYAGFIKTSHNMVLFHYNLRQWDTDFDYRPFFINEVAVPDGSDHCQRVKELHLNMMEKVRIQYGNKIPDANYMPPILELEWLRKKDLLSEEIFMVLEELGYQYMTELVHDEWYSNTIPVKSQTGWMEHLERQGAIIEVEDLEDTAKILSVKPLPSVKMPKIRSWNTIMAYGRDFSEVFYGCTGQSTRFLELYYHLPVLLAMFMVEYEADHLTAWPKYTRIQTEQDLRNEMTTIAGFTCSGEEYSYGLAAGNTAKDVSIVQFVLNLIYTRLHELNADMGLISFSNYMAIRGTETVRASVRLVNMDINWNDEIARAAREKEEQDEDLFDERIV